MRKHNIGGSRWIPVICLSLMVSSSAGAIDDPDSGIDHAIFSKLLQAAVSEGAVDYARLKKDNRLDRYLEQLASVSLAGPMSAEAKLALYINAYNAFAIKGILNGYSPASLLGRFRYFRLAKYRFAGEEITLHHLEHEVIRKLGEPRIHFALVCAARSCPNLRSEAYLPDTLNQQLRDNAYQFINDPVKNRFDREKKIAYLSSIFDWFSEDFAGSAGTVQQFVAAYVADPEIATDLAEMRYRVEYLDYDWRLNGRL